MGESMVIHRRIVKGDVSIVPGFNYIRNMRGLGTIEIFCSDDSTFTNITKSEAELIALVSKCTPVKVDAATFKRYGYNQNAKGIQETECDTCASTYTN
jgi:hypothetical protein